jgi:hypothetical protein
MHNNRSNSVTITSASFAFSHLRWSPKWPLPNSSTKVSINLFDPQYVPNIPPLYSPFCQKKNHESLHYATLSSLLLLSPASCYILLLILMMIMMINLALPSGARIRYSSRMSRLRLKCDGTCAETKFRLSAQRTSPFKSAGGRQFSRLLAAEVCASAAVMLDTPCSEVQCKTTGYPLHSHVSPSIPLPCVTSCHHISAGLYCNNSHDSHQR